MLKKLFLACLLTAVALPVTAAEEITSGRAVTRSNPAPGPVSKPAPVLKSSDTTIGGPFQLTDHNGKRVNAQTYAGKYMLVYFGFSSCPDICPVSLKKLTDAVETLGSKAERVVPIMISVDPERDTPEKLAKFVQGISPRLQGLTGTRKEIDETMATFKAYGIKMANPMNPTDYSYMHPDFVYIMKPDGTFHTILQASYDEKTFNMQLNSVIK
jgi:cytochrome oxidase Cu insertion factor (SCO1/SenC/PrrC family)